MVDQLEGVVFRELAKTPEMPVAIDELTTRVSKSTGSKVSPAEIATAVHSLSYVDLAGTSGGKALFTEKGRCVSRPA